MPGKLEHKITLVISKSIQKHLQLISESSLSLGAVIKSPIIIPKLLPLESFGHQYGRNEKQSLYNPIP